MSQRSIGKFDAEKFPMGSYDEVILPWLLPADSNLPSKNNRDFSRTLDTFTTGNLDDKSES